MPASPCDSESETKSANLTATCRISGWTENVHPDPGKQVFNAKDFRGAEGGKFFPENFLRSFFGPIFCHGPEAFFLTMWGLVVSEIVAGRKRGKRITYYKEGPPGVHFKNGKLYSFCKTHALVLSQWPDPRGWFKRRSHDWRPTRKWSDPKSWILFS